eukprot:14479120-Alexandrium_andersonii.AAC.1
MARVDERSDERLSREVQSRVEAGAAWRPARRLLRPRAVGRLQGEQGEQSGQAEPAFAGARPVPDEAESPH